MQWEQKFSVGVAAMDAEHQKFFAILNRLHEAMLAGKARALQQTILAELIAYTRTHFSNEEAMLTGKGYPKLAEHRQKHAAFTRQVGELEIRLAGGGSVLTIEIMDFLKNWLNTHILSEDVNYGAWIRRP